MEKTIEDHESSTSQPAQPSPAQPAQPSLEVGGQKAALRAFQQKPGCGPQRKGGDSHERDHWAQRAASKTPPKKAPHRQRAEKRPEARAGGPQPGFRVKPAGAVFTTRLTHNAGRGPAFGSRPRVPSHHPYNLQSGPQPGFRVTMPGGAAITPPHATPTADPEGPGMLLVLTRYAPMSLQLRTQRARVCTSTNPNEPHLASETP